MPQSGTMLKSELFSAISLRLGILLGAEELPRKMVGGCSAALFVMNTWFPLISHLGTVPLYMLHISTMNVNLFVNGASSQATYHQY